MAMPMLGQFDPAFTRAMTEVMALYRGLSDGQPLDVPGRRHGARRHRGDPGLAGLAGRARAGAIFGRFGHLLREIAERCRAEVATIEAAWGTVFSPDEIEAAIIAIGANPGAGPWHTSTTMAQPMDEIGAICRRHDVILYVDATATLGGMEVAVDRWGSTRSRRACRNASPDRPLVAHHHR